MSNRNESWPSARPLRLGTRGSLLAMAQSKAVATWVQRAAGVPVELVPIVTRGDQTTGPLNKVGGKGLFTAELERGLLDGSIDLAVHSLKDMPAELTPGLAIAAYPAREDPRDALVSASGALPALPPNSRVGTSSLRRSAQLLAVRDDLEIIPIRGNVETRVSAVLGRAHKGQPTAAVVLAMAGLRRAGLLVGIPEQVFPLEVEQFVPAAGQGTLAVQIAESNEPLRQLLSGLDDAATRASATAERSVLLALGADCHSCLAVHVMPAPAAGGGWRGLAVIGRGDGSGLRRFKCKAVSAQDAGAELAALLVPASRELGWCGQK